MVPPSHINEPRPLKIRAIAPSSSFPGFVVSLSDVPTEAEYESITKLLHTWASQTDPEWWLRHMLQYGGIE